MDPIEDYISKYSSPEDPLLVELDRETNLRVIQPRMISGHIQGLFLEFITRMVKPRYILEIGTFTGYSALCLAAGLPEDGIIDTIEIDDELQPVARSFFDRSPHRNKINHHIGSALDIAPGFDRTYDIVFIDGDKREYPDYFRMVMGDSGGRPLVKSGSYIIADNILWYGKVAQPIPVNDKFTAAIDEFNRMVAHDPRTRNVIFPIRDGLNIVNVL